METYYHAIDLLQQLITIPSLSRQEDEVAQFLLAAWEKDGHTVHRKGNNLWIYAAPHNPNKPTILLNSHIDTVKPAAGWVTDPFTPTIGADQRITGLGSNDAGASVVSLYAAFCELAKLEQSYNLIMLASCEEEVSGANGIASVLPELPTIDFAIVGEPTEMHPAIAEKGLMVVDCIAKGKSGHAARNEGINAISVAIPDIQWFNTYQFPQFSDLLGPVKMSVTLIEAGTQHNVIPDRCKFTVDIRTNEFYPNELLYKELQSKVQCEMTPRSFRLNSSRTPLEHPFVQRAITLGKTPFGSPTLSDQALMPFPSVKMGPGASARSHAADEFIHPMEIREAITLYTKLLNGLRL